MGEEKKHEKYSELRDGRHREQGQERELYPILHLVGEALQYPTNAKKAKEKKETHRQRAKKVVWRGVGVGD